MKDGYELRENVKLGVLPGEELLKDQKTSEIVGAGQLRLDRQGLHYEGTRNGGHFEIHMPPALLPTYGMCTDVTFFSTYYRDEYFEFIPERESTAKWLLATEENHRLSGGRWRNFREAETYNSSSMQ